MEITTPIAESEGRGAFRKLFMKLGEKVGTVKVSELESDYLNRAKDADSYKVKDFYLLKWIILMVLNNFNLI